MVNDLPEADLVRADLTEHNLNVLFELGMRIGEPKASAMGAIRSGLAQLSATFDETIPRRGGAGRRREHACLRLRALERPPLPAAVVPGAQLRLPSQDVPAELCHKYLSISWDTYRWNDGPNRKDNPAYASLSTSDALDNADSWAWLCLDLLIHPSGWPPKW